MGRSLADRTFQLRLEPGQTACVALCAFPGLSEPLDAAQVLGLIAAAKPKAASIGLLELAPKLPVAARVAVAIRVSSDASSGEGRKAAKRPRVDDTRVRELRELHQDCPEQ